MPESEEDPAPPSKAIEPKPEAPELEAPELDELVGEPEVEFDDCEEKEEREPVEADEDAVLPKVSAAAAALIWLLTGRLWGSGAVDAVLLLPKVLPAVLELSRYI